MEGDKRIRLYQNNAAQAGHREENLLYYAALLAGAGRCADAITREQRALLTHEAHADRTCIDGGSSLMFSVLALGKRHLRLITRQPQQEERVIPWLRTNYLPNGKHELWQSKTFIGEPPSAWRHAWSAAEMVGAGDCLRRIHGKLGPHSRLYTVNQALSPSDSPVTVGWQLDRNVPVSEALATIGYASVWQTAVTVWQALLAVSPHPRRGPWSINLALGGEPRLRLGSTCWARQIEDESKRRRLAELIESYHGDRCFAEGIYKLIQSTAVADRPHTIGRAVEIEVLDGQLIQLEFFLSVPSERF